MQRVDCQMKPNRRFSIRKNVSVRRPEIAPIDSILYLYGSREDEVPSYSKWGNTVRELPKDGFREYPSMTYNGLVAWILLRLISERKK